ncbi:hypothetical protein CJD36_001680 [Flavipsychrobacter stenotrophus]|uniref:Response regulatory domain-containing protein n=1 Tax=Flavipsychrobacter stenotrophus TaxID=2077091 RepID=A0A2S7T0Z3_9BACT|nr:response regulator [Flavipsychrobacter stenotrophus]PQJ12485.1 hypothetical protein CJD36_001680 [Flavipsychrobacter stenotrophus]
MQKNTVLLVDDDKFTRQVYKLYFEKHGYVIKEATNGNDATRLLDTNPEISVVLLDLLMPMHDGFNFLQNFSQTSANPAHDFKVILVTGLDEDEYRNNVMVKNIDTSKVEGYFNKPVDLKELCEAVDGLHNN